MNSGKGAYCPEWCTANHSPQNFVEDDLVVHWRGFGASNDGEVALVQTWVINCGTLVETSGVTVQGGDMQSPQDLRLLAQNCLEAAYWMEENLGHHAVSDEVSTQWMDHFAI